MIASGTISHEAYRARRHFPALDGLRAISIGLVMWEHSRNRAIAWWSHGVDGVVLFFVLSGFLITSLCLREETRAHRVDLRAFALRRAFRILPLYYIMLGVYVLLIVVAHLDPRRLRFLDALPYYAFFLQEVPQFHMANVPFDIAWSLGVEEKFYLLWPVFAFLALARWPQWRAPIAAGLAVVAALAPQFGPGGNYVFYESAILWGCVIALLLHDAAWYARLAWLGRPWVVAATLALAVIMHESTLNDNRALANVLLPITFALAVGSLVVTSVRWTRVLDARPLVAIGAASYVIYLTHQLFMRGVGLFVPFRFGPAGDIAVLILGGAAAIVASLLIHRWFEEPVTALGRRLSRGPVAAPATARS